MHKAYFSVPVYVLFFYLESISVLLGITDYDILMHCSVFVNEISKTQHSWKNESHGIGQLDSKINLPEEDQSQTHIKDSDSKVRKII